MAFRSFVGPGSAALCLLLCAPPPTLAQTAADPTRDLNAWSLAGGYQSISFRDVARTGVPVDGSPVALVGGGPAFVARLERWRATATHHVQVAVAWQARLGYETPIVSLPRTSQDRATELAVIYEHRRYPFRDVGMRGLDIGIGVQGHGGWTSIRRRYVPNIESARGTTETGAAGILALRLRRWKKVSLDLAWANGAVLARTRERRTEAAVESAAFWGGGWVTDLWATARVTITPRSALVVDYLDSGSGRLFSHFKFAVGSRRLAIGVSLGM